MSENQAIAESIRAYYTQRVREHGATCRGVDWNSAESQALRFEQLLKLVVDDPDGAASGFSLLDYGCGYAALLDHISEQWPALSEKMSYRGYDLSEAMIDKACERWPLRSEDFSSTLGLCEPADYVVASGIFNVKQDARDDEWEEYILESLSSFFELSRRGFSFNVLTSYSDREFQRDDLYYADPCWLFDVCRRKFSRRVSLLHDYGLYEFTIIVRTDG